MADQQTDISFEEEYLKETLSVAETMLKNAREAVDKKQAEIVKAKREFWENVGYIPLTINDVDDFEALVELNQNKALAADAAASYDELMKKIRRLENFVNSPYFARIDFRFEEDESPEKIYIGRTSLTEDGSKNIYVYDWRSPIASVFYRFMAGPAFYDAPAGRITGQLEKKRQYEIKKGRLLYFLDTDININDEILRQLLSKNTTPKMKTIVETIQKDQDSAIRDMESDLLMIQGVAGSGKTSIALHRAAYLMYQGLQSRLSANSILILSPNTAFTQYISEVLPELGEENAVSMVFEDLFPSILKGVAVEPQNAFLERMMAGGSCSALAKRSMAFKTSEKFIRILDQFIGEIPLQKMDFRDVYFREACIATKEEMREKVLQRPETPLAIRLEQLEEYILTAAAESGKKMSRAEKTALLEEIQQFTKLCPLDLYKQLWSSGLPFQDAEQGLAESIQQVKAYTLQNLESGDLPFDDATALLYFYFRIYGNNTYRNIQQVIIDEAQDYYPLQYQIFRGLFPNAKFTVLGDVNQTLTKLETASFYDRVQNLLGKKSVSLITLDKSFRCTSEILQFSLQFIQHKPEIQCFNRKGNAVEIASFPSHDTYVAGIVREVNECREKGFETVCLICKTQEKCRQLFSDLQPHIQVKLLKNSDEEGLKGVLLTPSYLAKGLEFDAVIICDGDSRNYAGEEDKRILYVECTRALHKLSLFCEGELTPLVTAFPG